MMKKNGQGTFTGIKTADCVTDLVSNLHVIVSVPATAMKFVLPFQWIYIHCGFDCSL